MCHFDFTGKRIIHQISQSQIAAILLANKRAGNGCVNRGVADWRVSLARRVFFRYGQIKQELFPSLSFHLSFSITFNGFSCILIHLDENTQNHLNH